MQNIIDIVKRLEKLENELKEMIEIIDDKEHSDGHKLQVVKGRINNIISK